MMKMMMGIAMMMTTMMMTMLADGDDDDVLQFGLSRQRIIQLPGTKNKLESRTNGNS